MAMRPNRQLLESPKVSLNASTSPSIASTVPMASPSVRRSARNQESPSVNYRDSLRSSLMRDTPLRQLGRRRSRSRSRSRIFGLDASNKSKLDRNSESETEEEVAKVPSLNSYKQQIMSRLVPILLSPRGQGVAASLLLLVMLVFTQWVAGQGVTNMMSWVVGPLSGLRLAIISLPEMMTRGSVRSKEEKDDLEMLVRLMKSDQFREVIEKVSVERMGEMGKEMDEKIREEVKMVRETVENVRKMYLDVETKRLAMREEELKMEKARQEGDEGGMVEIGLDVRQKLELVEIQIEQLKLSWSESTQQLRGREEVDELAEEMGSIRRMVEKLSKDRTTAELEQELGKMKGQVERLNDFSLTQFKEELETVKQQLQQTEGQGMEIETVKEVVSNMLADPLSIVNKKTVEQQTKEVDRLESMLNEVMAKVNQTEPKISSMLTEKLGSVKQNLEEELLQLTKTLHSDWSKSQSSNSVSLPQVSALLESHLSLFSADRTGQVDWASLAVGGSIISTPHTTTHPTPGQVLSLLGIPIWQHSTSPRQIIQPHAGSGQCWAFSGQSGQVVLQLGEVVRVTGVTIEHIRPSPDLSSAPRNILVWAHQDNKSLLNLTYSISPSSSSVQTFPITSPTFLPISQLRLQVTSNWGHPEYTCLYRVRVHGTQVKEGEDVMIVTQQDMRDS
eukprot:GFUD01043202.1.p1 GENE.GFUD01043202.1~~GFUD01043202.1.p1  ORF type:complete len:675 (+),score=266.97 GFUD01043202.1:78-2102(+)